MLVNHPMVQMDLERVDPCLTKWCVNAEVAVMKLIWRMLFLMEGIREIS